MAAIEGDVNKIVGRSSIGNTHILWESNQCNSTFRKRNFIEKLLEFDHTSFKEWGVHYNSFNKPWKILHVVRNQQFYNEGVKRGWEILEINGERITKSNEERLKNVLKTGDECSILFGAPIESLETSKSVRMTAVEMNTDDDWTTWQVTKLLDEEECFLNDVQLGWVIDTYLNTKNEWKSEWKDFNKDGAEFLRESLKNKNIVLLTFKKPKFDYDGYYKVIEEYGDDYSSSKAWQDKFKNKISTPKIGEIIQLSRDLVRGDKFNIPHSNTRSLES
jgi:hypothetical protein